MSFCYTAYLNCIRALLPSKRRKEWTLATAVEQLRTGDLLYFCDHSATGCGIVLFSGHFISHIAMAVRTDDNALYILEAVYHRDALADHLCSPPQKHAGVRLVPFAQKLLAERSTTFYAYAQLLYVDDATRRRMQVALKPWLQQVAHRRYEAHLYNLALAQYHWCFCCCFCCSSSCQQRWPMREDTSTMFCSELVADAYRAMGLIAARENVSLFVPDDFFAARVPLANYARLQDTGYYITLDDSDDVHLTLSLDASERGQSPPVATAPPPSLRMVLGDVVVNERTEKVKK